MTHRVIPEFFNEDRESTAEYLRKLKDLPKSKLKSSYFIRDLAISLLDLKEIKIDLVLQNCAQLGINIPKKDILDAITLWKDDNTLQAYRTPKLLLYTIRGDYDSKALKVFLKLRKAG